jgi:hypothetical protein
VISGGRQEIRVDFELPFGREDEGNSSDEFVLTREIALPPADYRASYGCEYRVESAHSDGGVSEHLGDYEIELSLFVRSDLAPTQPVQLEVRGSDTEDHLTFSTTNLEIGKAYKLMASPNLDFSDASLVHVFRRDVLHPEHDLDISNWGSSHFFRLVEETVE